MTRNQGPWSLGETATRMLIERCAELAVSSFIYFWCVGPSASVVTMRATLIRRLAAKMTETERSEALREANAKMREYAMNRPPIEKVKRKRKANSDHTLQMALAASFVTVFLATPLIGRKIAQDEEFRKKYVPAFYDYTWRSLRTHGRGKSCTSSWWRSRPSCMRRPLPESSRPKNWRKCAGISPAST